MARKKQTWKSTEFLKSTFNQVVGLGLVVYALVASPENSAVILGIGAGLAGISSGLYGVSRGMAKTQEVIG